LAPRPRAKLAAGPILATYGEQGRDGMLRFAVSILVVALGAGGSARAEPAGGRAMREDHPGYPYYRQYCAACHGVLADGLGPVAPALRARPPDLTALGAKYGTPLPRERLEEFVEGRHMVIAHGRSDMPVWGRRLLEEIPASPAKEPGRRAIIYLVMDYLIAIQPQE